MDTPPMLDRYLTDTRSTVDRQGRYVDQDVDRESTDISVDTPFMTLRILLFNLNQMITVKD